MANVVFRSASVWISSQVIDMVFEPAAPLVSDRCTHDELLVIDQSEFTTEEMAVVFHDACCAWSINDNEEQNFTLNNVTLGLRKGSFTAVIGEVRIVPYTFQLWYFKIP